MHRGSLERLKLFGGEKFGGNKTGLPLSCESFFCHGENAAAVSLVQLKNKLPPPFQAAQISFMGANPNQRCQVQRVRVQGWAQSPLGDLKSKREICLDTSEEMPRSLELQSQQPLCAQELQVQRVKMANPSAGHRMVPRQQSRNLL